MIDHSELNGESASHVIEAARMLRLDKLDQEILAELQQDGRRSYREIAKNVGAAPGTVRSRVKAMTDRGLLSIVAIPNLPLLGYRFHALVGIKVEPGTAVEIAKRLVPEEPITWIGLTVSGYDILVEVAAADAQEFGRYREEVLAQLPGFLSADVFVYWDLLKLGYRWTPANGELPVGDPPTLEP